MQQITPGKSTFNRQTLSHMSLRTCLESIDFFNKMLNDLSATGLKNILGLIGRKLEYKEVMAEEVIYGKGETSRELYFVVEGEVGGFIMVGNVIKEIRTFYEMEGFGDAEAVAQTNRLFATIAKKPTRLAILKPEDFSEILKDYDSKVYQAKFMKFQQNYILGGFSKSQLELIVHNTRQFHFNRNQIIYSFGDQSQDMYFIDHGQVKLYREVNRKQIQICVLQQGELLGEVQVILEKPRSSTAQCISQTLVMYKINKKLFFSQASQYMMRGVYEILQVKEQKRQQRFDQFSEKRIEIENPEVRLARISKMLEKGRKLANKRYSELDDGKIYGTPDAINFTRRVDSLVTKKSQVLEEGYKIKVQKGQIQKNEFFDFSKGLRPRILHYKSNQLKPQKRKLITQINSTQGSDDGIRQIKTISKLFDQEHCLHFRHPSHNPSIRFPTIKKRKLLRQYSFQL